MLDFTESAAALYSGGWRSEDKDELMDEYHLTDYEADEICKILAEMEKEDSDQ